MRFRLRELRQRLLVALGVAVINAFACLAGVCLRVVEAINRRGRGR